MPIDNFTPKPGQKPDPAKSKPKKETALKFCILIFSAIRRGDYDRARLLIADLNTALTLVEKSEGSAA